MKFIKIIFTILFTLKGFVMQAQDKVVLDEVIGVIGNEIVTKAEVEAKYAGMINQGMNITDNSRCEVLEDVLYTKMLLNQAKVDSIEVTESQVDGEMNRRLRYFISQFGSEEALVNYYDKPITKIKSEMKDALYEQLLVQGMQAQLTSGITITPSEVEDSNNTLPLLQVA